MKAQIKSLAASTTFAIFIVLWVRSADHLPAALASAPLLFSTLLLFGGWLGYVNPDGFAGLLVAGVGVVGLAIMTSGADPLDELAAAMAIVPVATALIGFVIGRLLRGGPRRRNGKDVDVL